MKLAAETYVPNKVPGLAILEDLFALKYASSTGLLRKISFKSQDLL